jgi:predicted ribosome quality control (RQC) complex YloA/Tae2 family protein
MSMHFSMSQLAAVADEVGPAVSSGWIQKVHQPSPREIVLEIRAPGRSLTLLLAADADAPRLHLLAARKPNPATPPAFCQFLRAHAQGARIDALEAGPQLVRLRLSAREGVRSLLLCLAAGHTDLLWLDDADRILASLAGGREKAGRRYEPPRAGPHEGVPVNVVPAAGQPFPVSFALEQAYQAHGETQDREQLRRARIAELKRRVKRTRRRIAALHADLERATRYRDYVRYGELLKANLGQIRKGQESVTVVDYFDPALPELVIPLDASKTPQANMDDYFRKHRKFLVAEEEIAPRLAAAEQEVQALQAEQAAIVQGQWAPPPAPTPQAGKRERSGPAERTAARKDRRPGPFKRFLSADGLAIYVGRNARENEELTHKFARSEDLWLHAQGVPGSHVVVRLEKGANPPPETLKDAATLALLYSDLKKSGKGEVIHTRRKWVRKAKGQAAGAVTVTQEKAMFVTLDRVRLDRLKGGMA